MSAGPDGGMLVAPGTASNPGTSGGSGAPQGPMGSQFLTLVIIFVGVMLVFSMMGTRRDRKKRDAMLSAIKKHDRVQTVGGVIGSVVEVKPEYIVLKVDESSNTRITFARSAVQQILTVSAESSAAPAAVEKAVS